jgi:putative component of membrane protein insertase Oxa1/YidC/SpoIIIJ protein YidD
LMPCFVAKENAFVMYIVLRLYRVYLSRHLTSNCEIRSKNRHF